MLDTATLHTSLADAVFAGAIMRLPQGDEFDTAHVIAGVIEDISDEIGAPSDAEVIEFGAALAVKMHGGAADGHASFAGQPVVIEDGETVDGMDGYRITVGDSNALFSFDEDAMEMILH